MDADGGQKSLNDHIHNISLVRRIDGRVGNVIAFQAQYVAHAVVSVTFDVRIERTPCAGSVDDAIVVVIDVTHLQALFQWHSRKGTCHGR